MSDRSPSRPNQDPSPRLQKVLASAGFGSRRKCEELILDGRVEIDRVVISELGTRVDPLQHQIRVDGDVVKMARHKCFVLNKPLGVISTARDPWARTRVIDLVDDSDRLFSVGRLDKSSSGLILVTNDGDLAHRLTHPSFEVEKVYRVVVAGKPSAEAMRQLRKGIHLSDGKMSVSRVTLKKAHATQSILEIVLAEGRNREIRRLLARVGHKVQQLKRIAIGPIRLGDLPVGAHRALSPRELTQLRQASDTPGRARRSSRGLTGRPPRQHDSHSREGQPRTQRSSTKSSSPRGTVVGGDRSERRTREQSSSNASRRPGRRPARRS